MSLPRVDYRHDARTPPRRPLSRLEVGIWSGVLGFFAGWVTCLAFVAAGACAALWGG